MNKAFTLSETLITLGIIGVVAVITFSVITRNVRQFVLKTQFKKSYNILCQAIEKSYADLGYISKCTYSSSGAGFDTIEAGCREFQKILQSNLNIINKCNRTSENCSVLNNTYTSIVGNSYDYIITLSDGTILFFYTIFLSTPIYTIDINGLKGPNKNGFDIHKFIIKNNKLKCYGDYGTGKDGSIKCSSMLEHLQ